MCRPIAIIVLLALGGVAPREEHPVIAVDVVGVWSTQLPFRFWPAFSTKPIGRMQQPSWSG